MNTVAPSPGSSARRLAVLLAALGVSACSKAPGTRGDAEPERRARAAAPVPPTTSLDSAAQFLLAAAAADFRAHPSPEPLRFRDVHVGHFRSPGGGEQYILCGQLLPAPEGGKAEWTPFATIRTSGYEQWIGAQAAGFCQGSSVTWDDAGDLSSALQGRLEAAR